MAETLHQLIGSSSVFIQYYPIIIIIFTRFYTSQVVQDFFHQQYLFFESIHPQNPPWQSNISDPLQPE